MALTFLDEIINTVLTNIVGGSAAQALTMGTLFIMTILIVMLVSARVDLGVAFVVVSPAIMIASFSGFLPPLSFGIAVLVLGLFFAGIAMAISR